MPSMIQNILLKETAPTSSVSSKYYSNSDMFAKRWLPNFSIGTMGMHVTEETRDHLSLLSVELEFRQAFRYGLQPFAINGLARVLALRRVNTCSMQVQFQMI